jgi:hypothetical protein
VIVGVGVSVGVTGVVVTVGVGVFVGVGVTVGVFDGVYVRVNVGVIVGVGETVGVIVAVNIAVGVGVAPPFQVASTSQVVPWPSATSKNSRTVCGPYSGSPVPGDSAPSKSTSHCLVVPAATFANAGAVVPWSTGDTASPGWRLPLGPPQ